MILEWFKEFLLVFTPLFVAIDAIGVLPLFISLTIDMDERDKPKLVAQASLTAFIVALLFLFLGRSILSFLGITEDDLRVGGGILLFAIAMSDLLVSGDNRSKIPVKDLAIVPIGIPLILGPASMTTILLLSSKHGQLITFLSVLINILIVWMTFRFSKYIVRIVGMGGTRAMGKVASLLLMAIAVMMIRVGITNFLETY